MIDPLPGTMDLAFTPFDPHTGLAAQRALFRDCFPEAIGQPAETLEHYQWKFHSAPGNPDSYEYGALLDGELIGYYAAVPYRYRCKGRVLTAGMVCDVMTGPKARGRGVFTKLGTYSLQQLKECGLDFVIGYPIRPEVLPGHLKVGWTVVQRMPVYVKVLRTAAILRRWHLGFAAPLANLAAGLVAHLASLLPSGRYTTAELPLPELLAAGWYQEFVDKWSATLPNALVKDPAFLRWRLGAPGAGYRLVVACSAAGDPVGLCIARATVLDGIPALALLDLMVLPGHGRAFRAIDAALRRTAKSLGCDLIATMMGPDWAQHYRLASLLYLRSPHVFSLIVKRLNPELAEEELLRPEVWHTMWIDSDAL